MRNASGHQCKVKMSGSEKKVNENTYHISSKNLVTKICFWKFHVVVVLNNGKEMYEKSVLHGQSYFLLMRPIVVFSPFLLPSPPSITRFYILFKQTLNIIGSFAFSPGEIYIILKTISVEMIIFTFFGCSGDHRCPHRKQ